MNILAIGSHPDDIEFGCSGTLIKYKRTGANIFLLVLSEGSSGGSSNERKREQMESAKIIGANEVFWGEYEDTKIPSNKDLIDRMEYYMAKVKPDFIFANYPEDTHQDHRNLASAVISAARHTKNLLFYEGPTSVNFNPNVFVDVSDVFDDKIRCLEAHASQVTKTNIEGLSILDIANASAHFRGTQGRVRFAEGFHPLRLFINI
ncbi:MAG: PIG-L deacetylase family protein [Thermodesulfobacteriota bacterium]